MNRARITEILRFGVVGTIGFLVDAAVLTLLTSVFAWTPALARAVSFPLALSVTWLTNRCWTFAHGRSKPAGRQYLQYAAIQFMGTTLNLSIYLVLISISDMMRDYPALALAVASTAAMFVNYSLSRRFAFAR